MLKLTISEDLGGASSGASGKDPLLYLLAVEQTVRYCMSTAQCLHVHCHGAHFIDKAGSQQLRDAVLRPVVERGALISFTGSEPGRTSRGLYTLLTTAERTTGGYVITGPIEPNRPTHDAPHRVSDQSVRPQAHRDGVRRRQAARHPAPGEAARIGEGRAAVHARGDGGESASTAEAACARTEWIDGRGACSECKMNANDPD